MQGKKKRKPTQGSMEAGMYSFRSERGSMSRFRAVFAKEAKSLPVRLSVAAHELAAIASSTMEQSSIMMSASEILSMLHQARKCSVALKSVKAALLEQTRSCCQGLQSRRGL